MWKASWENLTLVVFYANGVKELQITHTQFSLLSLKSCYIVRLNSRQSTTKPTNDLCSSEDSGQPEHTPGLTRVCAVRSKYYQETSASCRLHALHADSEDTDQTGCDTQAMLCGIVIFVVDHLLFTFVCRSSSPTGFILTFVFDTGLFYPS